MRFFWSLSIFRRYMFYVYRNPSWVDRRLSYDRPIDEIEESLWEEIRDGLKSFNCDNPVVSIVVPVLNEEVSVLRTLLSLTQNKTAYSAEIIVVNNSSTDRTQEVLDRVGVRSYFQPKRGWGPARQLGQENARGKYILTADADCFYPPRWIDCMTRELLKDGVTCVYGGYSFLGSADQPRWKLFIYELFRNLIAEVRHIKRPWYNCVGMCMGYVKDLGLRVGFIDRRIRGEDGRMCFELAQLGRIVRLRSSEVVVWTFPRTLRKDGRLIRSLFIRSLIQFSRFRSYLTDQPVHDTHTSQNFKAPSLKYFRRYSTGGPKDQDKVDA